MNLTDLTLVKEAQFDDPGQNIGMKNILDPRSFVRAEGKFENTFLTSPDQFFIENLNGLKIRFSEDFEMISVVQKEDYYAVKSDLDSFLLIESPKEILVVNRDGNLLSDFRFSTNAKLIGSVFYDFVNGDVLTIPLDAALK